MKYTVEQAKAWAAENSHELDIARLRCTDGIVQMLNRVDPEKSKQVWDSGCWLAEVLREHGATEEQIREIQFAAGQRSFGGDAWKASVLYANEFAATGGTAEKPGPELAAKIWEMLGS